jgi:hypothetical protein
VSPSKRLHQLLIGLFVCALAVSVFSLTNLAKCSQYKTGIGSEDFLAKATKI